MQVSKDFGSGNNFITAYTDTSITVGQREFRQNLILTPAEIMENWCDCPPAALAIDHFARLGSYHKLDLILLGTGTRLVFPRQELIRHFLGQGIGFEVMDSGAACRTFNVLLSEGREVAAAIQIETT